jgi:hypothetical protein
MKTEFHGLPTVIQQGTNPQNGKGRAIQLKKEHWFSKGMGYAFTGVDAYMRIREGESAPVAIGKALLTNMAWNMLPGGIPVAIGLGALQALPSILGATDAARSSIGSKSVAFGGGYTSNEGQEYMKQMGLSSMDNARNQAAAIMSRHARGAVKSY